MIARVKSTAILIQDHACLTTCLRRDRRPSRRHRTGSLDEMGMDLAPVGVCQPAISPLAP
jgi:hypothetical protein